MPCTSPIAIKNPNFGHSFEKYSFLKDCTSRYIYVPCGHCDACVAVAQLGLIQRCQMESLDHHVFFATLTYKNEFLPSVTCSSGYTYRYADVSHIQGMLKRLRYKNSFGRPFKVFYVSERGSQFGRPHFHVLFFVDKQAGDDFNTCITLEKRMFDAVLSEWCVNLGSRRSPDYHALLDYRTKFSRGRMRSSFDLHYVRDGHDLGTSRVTWYCLKYLLKNSGHGESIRSALKLNLEPDEFKDVWRLVRERWDCSLNFGDPLNPRVASYIKDCIRRSILSSSFMYPVFFSLEGKSFPLCSYYRDKFMTMDDAVAFYFKSPSSVTDGFVFHEFESAEKVMADFYKLDKKYNNSVLRDFTSDSEDLFN